MDGMANVLSKKYYALVVTAALVDIVFAVKGVAVPDAALLMKFGVEFFCERLSRGKS